MCDECHCYPHLPGCPNAPEPEVFEYCTHCGEEIYVGDEFAEVDCRYYHEECFRDSAASILIDRFGARLGVAEA